MQRAFARDASGIGAMVDWLCAEAEQPSQVAVAIETPHGPIVEALMDRGITVFRFSPAGAKDDRRDALVWPLSRAPIGTAFGASSHWTPPSWSCVSEPANQGRHLPAGCPC